MAKDKKPRETQTKGEGEGKPGGQPNNKNAFKHGLYAKRTANSKTVELSLKKDIAYLEGLLEAMSVKLDKSLSNNTALTDKERSDLYATLGIIDRRTTAIRTQVFISGEMSELEKEIEAGLFLAREDLGILDYLTPPEQLPRKNRSRKNAKS